MHRCHYTLCSKSTNSGGSVAILRFYPHLHPRTAYTLRSPLHINGSAMGI